MPIPILVPPRIDLLRVDPKAAVVRLSAYDVGRGAVADRWRRALPAGTAVQDALRPPGSRRVLVLVHRGAASAGSRPAFAWDAGSYPFTTAMSQSYVWWQETNPWFNGKTMWVVTNYNTP